MDREKLEKVIRETIRTYCRSPVIVAGNWKMNMTIREGMAFLEELGDVEDFGQVMIFPPYTALAALSGEFSKRHIIYGPQNFHEEDSGAYTGEISIPMVKELGCVCLLTGHSERRQYFNETDGSINRKVKKALHEGLQVMVCIGESLEERRSGRWRQVLKNQIQSDLKGVTWSELSSIYIAYEPVWAIGTGVSASEEQIAETHTYLKLVLTEYLGRELPILYGGSVNEKNALQIGKTAGVDGYLIGGASLKAASFRKILDQAKKIEK